MLLDERTGCGENREQRLVRGFWLFFRRRVFLDILQLVPDNDSSPLPFLFWRLMKCWQNALMDAWATGLFEANNHPCLVIRFSGFGKAPIYRNEKSFLILGDLPDLILRKAFAFGSSDLSEIISSCWSCPDSHLGDVLIDPDCHPSCASQSKGMIGSSAREAASARQASISSAFQFGKSSMISSALSPLALWRQHLGRVSRNPLKDQESLWSKGTEPTNPSRKRYWPSSKRGKF